MKLRTIAYNAYVCLSGAAVMLLEFAASRLLAPFFGTSIFVWGNIVGVVLIALSLGYYVGGKLADRQPRLEVISYYVLGAAVFTALIPVIAGFVVQPLTILQSAISINILFSIIGSFLVIIVLFTVPIFLLGMVSPFLIRIATDSLAAAGRTAGSLYAWSTLGSILGTFLGAFVLVPIWGSRETILLSSLLLMVIGVLGTKKYYLGFLVLLPLSLYTWLSVTPLRAGAEVIEQGETYYQYYAVTDADDRLLLQFNEGLGTQSMYMKDGVLTGHYYDYVALAPTLQGLTTPRVAVLGLAAGTLTRQLVEYYPGVQLTGVEIDGRIVDVAKRHFELAEQPMEIVVDDGRNFIHATKQQYDLIIIDAYTNEYYIPWHMTTVEFMEDLAKHQPANGMIALNIGSADEHSLLLEAMLHTIQQVYPFVYYVPVPNSGNYAVFASLQPLTPDPLLVVSDERSATALWANAQWTEYLPVPDAPVLTDNRAPVELYTEKMIWEYILNL